MQKNKTFKALKVSCVTLTILMVSFFLISPDVQAQNYARNFELISEINRLDPEQNPRYEESKDVLGRKVVDRKRRVVGDVKDIILNENGAIEQLNVDFNRLRLNSNIFLNYNSMGIEPTSDGYTMSFDSDQIEQLYPTLLAQVETAAGDADIFSVGSVVESLVKNEKGQPIGRVEDILFSAEGSRAEVLLVRLTQGTLRGDKVAVPFVNSSFEQNGNRQNIVLTNDMAKALVDFAKTN